MQAAGIIYQLWAPDEPVWGPVATVSHVHDGESREATSLHTQGSCLQAADDDEEEEVVQEVPEDSSGHS